MSDQQNEKKEKIETNFPIVGIGASAGGLAAFEAFFSGMPEGTDPGMAFVLVQHLAPDHKSILTDLIRRYTRMQVFKVEDGMEVKINCAYIIPQNRDMAFLNGRLHLFEPVVSQSKRLPVDFFFRSLAKDQKERAIGIILSGTGSDGALGVRAIKGEGGMVMVQKADASEYEGMPLSAIETGLVDYELLPADMPAQLIAYMSHAFEKPSLQDSLPSETEKALMKIFVLVRAQIGHDFSQYKLSTSQRRIERRMAVHQIENIEDYIRLLQQMPEEVEALFQDMLIGVTFFFRDPEAFKAIEEQVIPKLFEEKRIDETIRVWVPGCSTGEEAYSLAILMAEYQEKIKQNYKVLVFATDIDSRAVAVARNGSYPSSIASDVSPDRLRRYFVTEPGENSYRIHKNIRDMLVFSEQNVIQDPPFSKLDLISCRNLLIYLGSDLQQKIIPLFHYALKPDGFLFLGTSESIGEFDEFYTVIDRKQKIYQSKKEAFSTQRIRQSRFASPKKENDLVRTSVNKKTVSPKKMPLRELTEQALLEQVVQAAVLINAQGDILYLHGRTGMYLEPAPGESGTSNIIKMAREGLQRELTTALHKTVQTKETMIKKGLRVKTNGDFTMVTLTIRPVTASLSAISDTSLYLVILEQAQEPADLEQLQLINEYHNKSFSENLTSNDSGLRIAALIQELQAKEEYLQSANEELETSNEDLKSSNEEMQSVNEELQSANEELETSKEELQSVNEELATVNAELQTKVADLSQANNDMNNLLAGTGIATVFVDLQLRILRFTPTATKIINLIKSDIGRHVGHIVSNLPGYDSLKEDTQAVLDTLVPREAEVQTVEGRWYTMRIQPYRTVDNVIEGVVLTFVDITKAKALQEELRENEQRLRDLSKTKKQSGNTEGS